MCIRDRGDGTSEVPQDGISVVDKGCASRADVIVVLCTLVGDPRIVHGGFQLADHTIIFFHHGVLRVVGSSGISGFAVFLQLSPEVPQHVTDPGNGFRGSHCPDR